MKTAVRRVLLLSALLSPSALYALGLGEIRLNSALNQPFDAEIELVSAAQEDLAALRASLASSDTFLRYGLDKPSYLSEFTFQVARVGGRDVLRVTSPKAVTEPFVTLLVEANWPRGRLLREYTVLLDPPVFAPAPAAAEAPVVTPRAASAPPAAVPRPQATAAPAPSAPRASRPVAVARTIEPGASYRVQPNDTLWQIASSAYPGTKADVNRAMVAIYQANPGAFGGNINVLRAGSELRIPASDDLAGISASAAASEVSRQYQMWRDGVTQAPGDATDGGRLRLVTPEQGSPAPSAATAAPAAAAPAAGGDELQSRVQRLEAELAEARRLLEVRSAELATLQGGAAAPETTTAAEPAGAEVPAVEPPEPAAAAADQAVAPAPEAEPAAEPAPKPERPRKTVTPDESPSLLDQLLGYWWVLLGVLVAALGVVAFMRRRREQGSAEESLEEALGDRDLRKAQAEERIKAHDIKVEEEERGDSTMKLPRPVVAAAAPREREPSPAPASMEDTLSGEGPLAIESGDPLAEADFHMAYGLYDQAADLIQVASKREPGRRDLRVKLLEIYFVWGNRDRFLELANELGGTRDRAEPGEWDKVLIMGKQLAPEDPMFRGPIQGMGGDLDMDLKGATGTMKIDMLVDRSPGETTRTQKIERDGGLDFLLDEPSRGVEEGTGTYAPTVELPRPRPGLSEDPTAEVGIMDLGLDMGDLPGLDNDDIFASMKSETKAAAEDTIESETLRRAKAMPEEDLLTASNILGSAATTEADDKTMIAPKGSTAVTSLVPTVELNMLDSASETSELPALEPTVEMNKVDATGVLPTLMMPALDIGEGEATAEAEAESHTLSEVGTKLDLARAYVDMGDPEGARSILEEVVKEGSAAQKQEAERLMASLP
jgi:pilus assembly protein FimV